MPSVEITPKRSDDDEKELAAAIQSISGELVTQ